MFRIRVDGQILQANCCDVLVSDSLNVLKIQFEFSGDWDGMTKTAQFTQKVKGTEGYKTYNVLVNDGNLADFPNEITDGIVIISVFGALGEQRMTTAPMAVPVVKSGFIGDGETPVPPTPDLYQQLLEAFKAGGVSPEEIGQAVADYLAANPITESDPTVPEWAKAEEKPGYNLSELTEDATHRTVTDEEKTAWNEKSNFSGKYSDLDGLPEIPGAYSLPVANASTLGGVKPVEKTDEMTQPVGVDSTGALFTIPGGGGGGGESTYTFEETVLASGTIVAGETPTIRTGVTIGMLRQYKMFYLYLGGASNKALSNWYIRYAKPGESGHSKEKSLMRVNGSRAFLIIYHFYDEERKILMPYDGATGNVGEWTTLAGDYSKYGVQPAANMMDSIYVVDDTYNDAELFIYPASASEIDVKWRIQGVLK